VVHGCDGGGGAISFYDTELDNSIMLLSGSATAAVFDGGGLDNNLLYNFSSLYN
jgi:hypothetical protein